MLIEVEMWFLCNNNEKWHAVSLPFSFFLLLLYTMKYSHTLKRTVQYYQAVTFRQTFHYTEVYSVTFSQTFRDIEVLSYFQPYLPIVRYSVDFNQTSNYAEVPCYFQPELPLSVIFSHTFHLVRYPITFKPTTTLVYSSHFQPEVSLLRYLVIKRRK